MSAKRFLILLYVSDALVTLRVWENQEALPKRIKLGGISVIDSSEPAIGTGSLVTLHFSLALSDGEIIDSTFGKKPAKFRIGDGNMLPGFEAELMGLKNGDGFEKTIPHRNAFGEVNPKNIQRFPIENFKHLLNDDMTATKIGNVISFTDAGGFEIPGVVKKILDKEIVIDFNHPLSGKDIIFKVSILSVLDIDADSVVVKV
ncbi:MAG: peptidylprolyl isomerase [Gammaproteobacteria bacterium]|nr:peptidylprolyl isomerase [Gammaproteobacteria bacterium]